MVFLALCVLFTVALAAAESTGFSSGSRLTWDRANDVRSQGEQSDFVVAPHDEGAQGKNLFGLNAIQF